MKKLATLAVLAALVGSAHAAAITWGFGGVVYVTEKMTETAVKADGYTGTAVPWQLALVYVGQEQDSFSIDDLTSTSVLDTMNYAISTSSKSAGKWSPSTKTFSTTDYADKASFAVVLYDSTKTAFSYIYSGTSTAGDAVTSATTVADMSARGSGMVYGAGSDTASGVVVVPEPSVALLGLLGIGMLLKRRRA